MIRLVLSRKEARQRRTRSGTRLNRMNKCVTFAVTVAPRSSGSCPLSPKVLVLQVDALQSKGYPNQPIQSLMESARRGFHCLTIGRSGQTETRCLTIRSTGHFAAVQVWASFHSRPNPACRKMPVSSNVSHQTENFVNSPITFKSCLRKHISASLSSSTANTNCKLRSMALNTCQIRKHIQPSAEQGTARLPKDKYTAEAWCASRSLEGGADQFSTL